MVTELVRQVKGLVLGIDDRQSPEIHVLDGANFLVNAEGPFSAFGSQFVTYEKIININDVATFTIESDKTFVFTSNAVLQLDALSQKYFVVFSFPEVTDDFPWSFALVGSKYYFAKKGADLFQYTPLTNAWKTLTPGNTSGLTPDIYAVTETFGRLIILSLTVNQWSAIDDGEIYEDLSLGAGSQSLAIIGNGKPLGVFHVDLGFITFTNKGILLFRRVEAQIPFRYDIVNQKTFPISPYAIVEIEKDLHIFLAKSGLFTYNGRELIEWQPLMSEFLRQKILPDYSFALNNNPQIRLFFDSSRQWFFVATAFASTKRFYNKTYALYVPRNEWGSFDKVFSFAGPLVFEEGINAGFNYGFFDVNGLYNLYTIVPQTEIVPNLLDNVYFQTHLDIPVRRQDSTLIVSEIVEADVYDKSPFTVTGIYDLNNMFVQRNMQSIDSFIEMGLIRLSDPQYSDRYSELTDVILGIGQIFAAQILDYELVEPEVIIDWELVTPDVFEDWGLNITSEVSFTPEAIGTLDGHNQFENERQVLTELEKTTEYIHYTCDVNGIYHKIRIEAQDFGQEFAIKTLQPVVIPTGRM